MHNYREVDVDAWAYEWFSGFADMDLHGEIPQPLERAIHGTLFLHPLDRESDAKDLKYGMRMLSLIGRENPYDANSDFLDERVQHQLWESEHQHARLICRQIVRTILEDAENYAAIRVEREHAGTDYLTGLANRRGLLEQLKNRYGITDDPVRRSSSGEPLPPIKILHAYGDLNKFKWINDTLGHHVGDAALVEAAWRAQDVFRQAEAPIIYRHGGDEFGAILGGLSDYEIDQVVERLMNRQIDRVIGSPYKESMRAVEERVEAVRASGERIRAEARPSELTKADIFTGKRPHHMLYINGMPVAELDNMVSFSVGVASAFVSTYDDIESLRRRAEVAMEHVKPILRGLIEEALIIPPGAD